MQRIPLLSMANQRFEYPADGLRYIVTLNQVTNTSLLASCTIILDSTGETRLLFSGFQVAIGVDSPLIPFRHLEYNYGNFYFITPNNEIPNYKRFSIDHRLYYLDASEIKELRDAYESTKVAYRRTGSQRSAGI